MWKCKHCSEQIEDNFDICFSCGYTRSGSPSEISEDDSVEGPFTIPEHEQHSHFASNVAKEYSSSYNTARGVAGIISFVG